jgi:predicted nuclease with TOPRIM domain
MLNMSVYGYGNMLGGAYGYPRREIKIGMVAQPRKWAKAVIFNRAIAAENPWIKHLRAVKAYHKIRRILEKSRKTYVPKNPERRKANLMKELNKLQTEYDIIKDDYPGLKEEYSYTTIPFEQARKAELDRILTRANKIANELGVQVKFKV